MHRPAWIEAAQCGRLFFENLVVLVTKQLLVTIFPENDVSLPIDE